MVKTVKCVIFTSKSQKCA